jgi:hypothetical protein
MFWAALLARAQPKVNEIVPLRRDLSVDCVGVDDDFDATILGFAGGCGVGGERVVLAHREHGELARRETAALHKLLEDGLGLRIR